MTKPIPEAERMGLTSMERNQTVTWAAQQAGESYGQFYTGLEDSKKNRIYSEYAAEPHKRRADEQARLLTYRKRRGTSRFTFDDSRCKILVS